MSQSYNVCPSINKLPYKSLSIALLFCIFFGPVGLLYASFWGGIIMLLIGLVVFSSKLFFPSLVVWVICAIIAVRAVERYNRKLLNFHSR